MQHVDVGDGVGASGILDYQVIESCILALLKADSEIRLRQGAEVVADLGVLSGHVDDHGTVRQFPEVFVLVRFQHTHEAEVLWRDFIV